MVIIPVQDEDHSSDEQIDVSVNYHQESENKQSTAKSSVVRTGSISYPQVTTQTVKSDTIEKVTETVVVKSEETKNEITYRAICLYKGDDVDGIPASKMAIVVAVTRAC